MKAVTRTEIGMAVLAIATFVAVIVTGYYA